MQRYLLEPLLISMCLAGFRVVDSESIFLVGSVSVTDSQIQNASKIDNLSSIIHWQKFFFIHLKLLTFIHNTLGKNLTLWWIILGRILIRVLSVSRFVSGSSEGSGTGFRFGFLEDRIGSVYGCSGDPKPEPGNIFRIRSLPVWALPRRLNIDQNAIIKHWIIYVF